MTLRAALIPLAFCVLLGASPAVLDSQYVLQRYAVAVAAVTPPKVVIYSYTVSQAGPTNIEQRHRIYRSGTNVRDETLSIDGNALHRKVVRFSHREDAYTVARFAPRTSAYELLFLGTERDGRHLDYVYEATPLARPAGASVDRLTIDGANFPPRNVHFRSSGPDAEGTGEVEFGLYGRYWMPTTAVAEARVKGKPARERIAWSDYRFPESLPPSTFQPPEPLVHATSSP